MLARFSVTINDAFQSTGGAIMNKTVAMVLTKKVAGLVRVPEPNSGNIRRMMLKEHSQRAHMRIRDTISLRISISHRHDPCWF